MFKESSIGSGGDMKEKVKGVMEILKSDNSNINNYLNIIIKFE